MWTIQFRRALRVVVIASVLAWGGIPGNGAPATAEFRCAVCSKVGEEGAPVFDVPDAVTLQPRLVCGHCRELKTSCAVCGIPMTDPARDLGDGRFLCARDAAAAVMDGAEIARIASEAFQAVTRTHARFLALPARLPDVSVATQKELAQAGPEAGCLYPALRLISSRREGAWQHRVLLLSGQPRSWVALEAAHALAHTWLAENLPAARKLDGAVVEAFCDLVAWRAAEEMGWVGERPRLERSKVGDGQLELLLEADRTYDFNVVKEWVLYGRGNRLVAGEADRVRLRDDSLKPAVARQELTLPSNLGRPEPADRLSLNGIVGSGKNQLALINEATLAAGEKGKVRLNTGVLELELLEIRTNSVVIKVTSTGQRVELPLRKKS